MNSSPTTTRHPGSGARRRRSRLRAGGALLAALVAVAVAVGGSSPPRVVAQDGGASAGLDDPAPVENSDGSGSADEAPAAEARVWGALVYLGDRDLEGLPDGRRNPRFVAIEPRLRKVFREGRHAVLLAEHTQTIFKEYESWVVPSKELFLKIDSRGPSPDGGTKIDLQVWQGERVLVKTNAVLRRDAPLIIGGPRWRDGRLVFVVELL